MATPRPILIVEDDAALRSTLVEQLAMDGDFVADEAGSAAEAEAKLAAAEARYDAILLDIGLPDADGRDFCAKLRRDGRRMPIIMLTGARCRSRRGARPRCRGERLYRQALPPVGTAGPGPRPAARLRQFGRRGLHHRPLHVPPQRQAAAGAGPQPQGPADRQGKLDPEIPVPRRRQAGAAADPAERGLGLQQRGHHPHAGDPHLPPAPEDRARSLQHPAAADRGRRLQAGPGGDHAVA